MAKEQQHGAAVDPVKEMTQFADGGASVMCLSRCTYRDGMAH